MILKRRDKVIARLVNFIMRFASEDYRNFIFGAIVYGMNAAKQDVHYGLEPPPNWWEEQDLGN